MALNLSKKQWVLSHLILALLLSLSLSQFFNIRISRNVVSFLDVGQGDSILIQTEEGRNILIDTGPNGKVVEKLSETLNFFNQKIDLFILTHPDLDHYGGILDVMQKYPIKAVMITGVASESSLYMEFIKEMRRQNIPLLYPSQQKDLQISQKVYLDFLYPFEKQNLMGQEVKNKNDTSVSLILRNVQKEPLFLLTGDAEEKQEKELLLSGQDFAAHVFKLGHHGSKTSSTAAFLNAIEAKKFVVSAGKDNKFGHPHQEVLDRLDGKELRNTAEEGSIHFVLE